MEVILKKPTEELDAAGGEVFVNMIDAGSPEVIKVIMMTAIKQYATPLQSAVREAVANQSDACETYLRLNRIREGTASQEEIDIQKNSYFHYGDLGPAIYEADVRNASRHSQVEHFYMRFVTGIDSVDQLEFIDYATGFSPIFVEKIFRRLGKSTKSRNSVEVGGFGLGSKAIFAYTDDIVNIETIYKDVDGKKYYKQYQASLIHTEAVVKGQGYPVEKLKELGIDMPTHFIDGEYQTGLRMTYPIKDRKSLVEVFEYAYKNFVLFDKLGIIIPEFLKIDNYKQFLEPMENSLFPRTYRFSVLNKAKAFVNGTFLSNNAFEKKMKISVGRVMYPLDLDALGVKSEEAIKTSNTIFNFKVDELSIPPSRESIIYDDHSKRVILDRVRALRLEAHEFYANLQKDKLTAKLSYLEAAVRQSTGGALEDNIATFIGKTTTSYELPNMDGLLIVKSGEEKYLAHKSTAHEIHINPRASEFKRIAEFFGNDASGRQTLADLRDGATVKPTIYEDVLPEQLSIRILLPDELKIPDIAAKALYLTSSGIIATAPPSGPLHKTSFLAFVPLLDGREITTRLYASLTKYRGGVSNILNRFKNRGIKPPVLPYPVEEGADTTELVKDFPYAEKYLLNMAVELLDAELELFNKIVIEGNKILHLGPFKSAIWKTYNSSDFTALQLEVMESLKNEKDSDISSKEYRKQQDTTFVKKINPTVDPSSNESFWTSLPKGISKIDVEQEEWILTHQEEPLGDAVVKLMLHLNRQIDLRKLDGKHEIVFGNHILPRIGSFLKVAKKRYANFKNSTPVNELKDTLTEIFAEAYFVYDFQTKLKKRPNTFPSIHTFLDNLFPFDLSYVANVMKLMHVEAESLERYCRPALRTLVRLVKELDTPMFTRSFYECIHKIRSIGLSDLEEFIGYLKTHYPVVFSQLEVLKASNPEAFEKFLPVVIEKHDSHLSPYFMVKTLEQVINHHARVDLRGVPDFVNFMDNQRDLLVPNFVQFQVAVQVSKKSSTLPRTMPNGAIVNLNNFLSYRGYVEFLADLENLTKEDRFKNLVETQKFTIFETDDLTFYKFDKNTLTANKELYEEASALCKRADIATTILHSPFYAYSRTSFLEVMNKVASNSYITFLDILFALEGSKTSVIETEVTNSSNV